jgi:hypothetical protein
MSYVEDEKLILPILVDGVTRLGDLWNCVTSQTVGENLFEDYLDGEYVNASPIDSLEYQIIHNKSSSDKMKTVKVEGEVSLELLAGLIKVKGAVKYNNSRNQFSSREELTCYYSRSTFAIDAHTNAKKLLNRMIVEKVINKELKVTHFVRGVILGAEVKADILVTKKDKSDISDIEGEVLGTIVYGPINAKVKADLSYFDSEKNENYDKEINVNSVPTMKVETNSVEEMFRKIEEIDTIVKEHKHFQKKGENIIGVPIRFVLVPIKQFLDFDIQKSYLKLSKKILKDFNEMLIFIQDIQNYGYIVRKVLKSNVSLALIISDPRSKLTQSINEYEKKLRDDGCEFFEESLKALKSYKNSQGDVECLIDIRNRFDKKLNLHDIDYKIQGFVNEGEGKRLYFAIKFFNIDI